MATHTNLPAYRLSLCLCAGVASLGILLLRSFTNSLKSDHPKIILSPKDTVLPNLPREEIKSLPYPPDALPGARDVDSPYGSTRVYEWGPEDGRKVLFVHGISTPCIALAGMAHRFVDKGCRVMLFDLYGRGFSSSPSPTGPNSIQHDSRLYTTQILLSITSSPLHWSSFSLIGYSLGGGLAADFTSHFPRLVSSLILLAPSGLIRTSHTTLKSRLLYSPTSPLPSRLVERLVAARLHTGPPTAQSVEPEAATPGILSAGKDRTGTQAVHASSHTPLLPGAPASTVAAVVDWQLAHHAGFVPAFVSSIRYAPIRGQHARWRVIGERLSAQNAAPGDTVVAREGLERGKVLVLLGVRDQVVVADEVAADVEAVLGSGNVDIRVLDAGHEVPIERVDECVGAIWGFWGCA
ncbi:alpha/beta-hydrolase [Cenococcum geophilum 1.58]|uniref:alpha/beta-hydrolase n=1 Tax=Cenococcum geophilum 1.58 TaxID=794803 RepID=UPI00358DF5F8|nr:alpha/beta-hydrolase [Cenococcum geophilum 1.58]